MSDADTRLFATPAGVRLCPIAQIADGKARNFVLQMRAGRFHGFAVRDGDHVAGFCSIDNIVGGQRILFRDKNTFIFAQALQEIPPGRKQSAPRTISLPAIPAIAGAEAFIFHGYFYVTNFATGKMSTAI